MRSNYLSLVFGRMAACLPILFATLLLSSLTTSGQHKKRSPDGASKPASQSGVYRNLFREAGYKQAAIDEKINKAWYDIFEGPQRVYFEVGDSMAYVSDVKNHDARTEGLSYGMMIAVQLNKKDQFDRIWRWSKQYLQHQTGPREGYFAWSIDPKTMKKNSEGSASDGELYYITSLLFAANRWGNHTGIHYYNEARRILDAMWKKDGTGNIYNLINTEHKQISFVPEGGNYNWTDPSYHLPAFYEVWAMYAKDGHEQFYLDCADTSRVFLHRACHPVTGLNTDYAEFSGQPHPTRWMPPAFRYDSWRVPMNIAMDYTWFGKDKGWQEDYARRFQGFLRSKGMDSYEDQFNVDGSRPDFILQAGSVKKLRHSIGLVSTAATASLINKEKNSKDFVQAIWNAKLEPYEDGYFDPYYDGLLYLFSLLHLSGKYQLIKPSGNLSAVAVAQPMVRDARTDQDRNGERAATNVRSAAYPQIMPGSRVAFRIKAPEAQKVQVDLGRKYDMLKDTGGYWKVTTDSIGEGFHYYSLLIDGVALADPASETFYGMGRMASGIEIPFAGGDYYSVKNVPHGEIRIKRYFSTVTSSWRRFYIYTPPGYESATQTYPVLYLLHGGGEDERGWATQGKTDLIMDNLIASKKARPMLIVMMDGNIGGGGFTEQALINFENELKQAAVPFVESNYRAGKGPANRALAGLSMGGLQTLYAGIKNTALFGYLGVFSSGWLPMQQSISEAQYQFIKDNKAAIQQNLQLLWIAMGGKEDIAYNNCKIMLTRFDDLQLKYQYSEYPGGHTWPVWRNNLYSFAPLLFK